MEGLLDAEEYWLRRKNSTGARPPLVQGGRTVQKLDLTPVQGNQEEGQYRS